MNKPRGAAEAGHQQLVQRFQTLDTLVGQINNGLAVANDNFAKLEVRTTQSEVKLAEANATFQQVNVQKIQLEISQMMQALPLLDSVFKMLVSSIVPMFVM